MANADALPVQAGVQVDKKYQQGFMEAIEKLRLEKKYTDITLTADGREFACHKVVLAGASEYFNAMFSSGLKESHAKTIDMKGTDAETLETLVKYIYSGHINITEDNVQGLVQAADQYQFEEFTSNCQKFMVQHVCPANCIGSYKFSKQYQLAELEKIARTTMMENFADVVRSHEFSEMSADDIIEYISDDHLNVSSEDAVFEAVSMWVRADPKDRTKTFPQIAAQIRFPFCTRNYLSDVVQHNPFMDNMKCSKYAKEACTFHMQPEHRHEIWSPRTKPRISFPPSSSLIVLGGLENDKRNQRVLELEVNGEVLTWREHNDLQKAMTQDLMLCSMVATELGIITTGGATKNTVSRNCRLYDTKDQKWKVLPGMNNKRAAHASVVHNGNIYVIGGRNAIESLKSMEMYSPKSRKWSLLPDLPTALQHLLAVAYGQYIYVVSGYNQEKAVGIKTWAYNTLWREWEERKDMPEAVSGAAAAVLNDSVFVVGGHSSCCLHYDMTLDTWTTLSQPSLLHLYPAAAVWQGKVLLCGGNNGEKAEEITSVIESYDPATDTWSTWDLELKEPLWAHHMLVAPI